MPYLVEAIVLYRFAVAQGRALRRALHPVQAATLVITPVMVSPVLRVATALVFR